MREKKVVISGYYGFGNIGDEAILESIVDSIREKKPNTEIVVLSSNPQMTSNQLNVKAISRLNMLSITKELLSASLFISGGGGLMQDVTGPSSVIYYGTLLKTAQMLGVPTMIYAQGIGPIHNEFNKKLTGHFFNKASAINVREIFSKNDLVSYGVPENKIKVTADPVLLMKYNNQERIREIITKSGLNPDQGIIGISIRPWKAWYERQLKAFTSVIYQIARKYKLQILLIPFQLSSDLWLCKEAETCFNARPDSDVNIKVLSEAITPKEMLGVIGYMRMIVGMRLHSLIMAGVGHVPSLGIAYDPKVKHFSELAGFPYVQSVADLQDIEKVLPALEAILSDYENSKKLVQTNIPKLQELAYENVKTALSFL